MFEELKESVLTGNEERACELTRQLLQAGADAGDIVNRGLIAGMDVVGQRFRTYEMYLPEVIQSSSAMKSAMEIVKPHLSRSGVVSLGTVLMATIEGDVHDIGKNLVSMMLEGAGFTVKDLGVDVPVRKIIDVYRRESIDVIGISALLTTTMLALEDTIQIIREEEAGAVVIVGGAPLTQEFADKVGADGFAPDALRAINLVKTLVGK
jgi:5-methyltetrahydrofolate--homocysteine methyltransferase